MKTIGYLFFSLFLGCLVFKAQAEIHKCKSGENVSYQSTPCSGGTDGHIEIIPQSAEKNAIAKQNFKTWQDNYNASESAKIKSMESARDRQLREIEVNTGQFKANSEQGQADALNRNAAALEEKNRLLLPQKFIKLDP